MGQRKIFRAFHVRVKETSIEYQTISGIDYLQKIDLQYSFPNSYTYLGYQVNKTATATEITLNFRGDRTQIGGTAKTANQSINFTNGTNYPSGRVDVFFVQTQNTNWNTNFLPDTVGGSILVGTKP